jgi:superfamily II DNA or RNA helicase
VQLRDYQETNIAEIRSLLRTHRAIVWQLSTGAGKSYGSSYMLGKAAERGKPSWFCCHRREIATQVSAALKAAGVDHGFIMAGAHYDPRKLVHVCSIDTLRRRLTKLRKPSLLVLDECHHVLANTWSEVFESIPNAAKIGLSATPRRTSGEGLGKHFSAIVCGPPMRELIERGYLKKYRLFGPAKHIDVSNLHVRNGDYVPAELDEIMSKPQIVGDAVAAVKRYAHDRKGIIFCHSIEASQRTAESFRQAGIVCVHVDGKTDDSLRVQIVRDFERGVVQYMTNVSLYGEGIHCPGVSCVVQLRPTESLTLDLQQKGRGLAKSNGDADCILIDQASNFLRFGLPDDERSWALDYAPRGKKKEASVTVRQCPACYAAMPGGAVRCAECGHIFEAKPRTIEEIEGELAEVDTSKRRELTPEQLAVRREQGMAKGLDQLIQVGIARARKKAAAEGRPFTERDVEKARRWATYVNEGRKAKMEREARERGLV